MEFQKEIDLYYIAIVKDGIPILEIDFQSEGLIPETVLLTGFVSAISAFSKEFVRGELKTIDQGEYKLTFVEGNQVSIVIVSSSISEPLRNLITTILLKFEETYDPSLHALNLNYFDYEDFKEIMIADIYNFKTGIIKPYYVPIYSSNKNISSLDSDSKLIYSIINGSNNVADIVKMTNLKEESTIKILTALVVHDFIEFKIMVDSYDIPMMTSLGRNNIFNSPDLYQDVLSILGENWNRLIKKIDGTTSIKNLASLYSSDLFDICQVMTQLTKREYITLLPIEMKLCLIFEKFYTKLYQSVKGIMGNRGETMFIDMIESKPDILRNLIVFDNNTISFEKIKLHVADQKNISLEDIGNSLIPPLNQILKYIEKFHGTKYVQKLKNNNLEELMREFREVDVNLFSKFLDVE